MDGEKGGQYRRPFVRRHWWRKRRQKSKGQQHKPDGPDGADRPGGPPGGSEPANSDEHDGGSGRRRHQKAGSNGRGKNGFLDHTEPSVCQHTERDDKGPDAEPLACRAETGELGRNPAGVVTEGLANPKEDGAGGRSPPGLPAPPRFEAGHRHEGGEDDGRNEDGIVWGGGHDAGGHEGVRNPVDWSFHGDADGRSQQVPYWYRHEVSHWAHWSRCDNANTNWRLDAGSATTWNGGATGGSTNWTVLEPHWLRLWRKFILQDADALAVSTAIVFGTQQQRLDLYSQFLSYVGYYNLLPLCSVPHGWCPAAALALAESGLELTSVG